MCSSNRAGGSVLSSFYSFLPSSFSRKQHLCGNAEFFVKDFG